MRCKKDSPFDHLVGKRKQRRAGELSRDHFRKDNREAIRKICREFVVLCRRLELFSEAGHARTLKRETRPSGEDGRAYRRPTCEVLSGRTSTIQSTICGM